MKKSILYRNWSFFIAMCIFLLLSGGKNLFSQSKKPAGKPAAEPYIPFGAPPSSSGPYVPFPQGNQPSFGANANLPPPPPSNSAGEITENLLNELSSSENPVTGGTEGASQADTETAVTRRELAEAEIQKEMTEKLFADQAQDTAFYAAERPAVLPPYEIPFYRPRQYFVPVYGSSVIP